MTDRYEEFSEKYFGTPYEIWHDGPSTGRLHYVPSEEREYVWNMLLEGMRREDSSAVEGLGIFDAVRALPFVRKAFPSHSATMRLALIQFLREHDPEKNMDMLADTLMSLAFTPATCLSALIALRNYPLQKVVAFLLEGVSVSPEYLFRYHAAASLLHVGKVQPSTLDDHPGLFAKLSGEAPETWAAASNDLRQLIISYGWEFTADSA